MLNPLILLMVFLLAGFVLREVITPLKKLYIPASMIGGIIALILGPQVLGLIQIPDSWSSLASPMVNIVIACMIFGITIKRGAFKGLGGTIVSTFFIYCAQVAVGSLVGFGLSKVWTSLPEQWGVMPVFCFYGGHGGGVTAGDAFASVGIENMTDMGIVLSTIGLLVALTVGMFWVNYGIRKGYAQHVKDISHEKIQRGALPDEERTPIGKTTVSTSGVAAIALQLALILFSMWVGGKIIDLLALMIPALSKLPSLLYGVIGSFIVWHLMVATKTDRYADKATISSISGLALDICICAATATLNLKFIAANWVPILIMSIIMTILVSVFCMILCRRWVNRDWFEFAMNRFGSCTGVSATGWALFRCVDPDSKTSVAQQVGLCSALDTPFSSTMIAFLPLVAATSFWPVVGIFCAATIVLFLIGELVLHRANKG